MAWRSALAQAQNQFGEAHPPRDLAHRRRRLERLAEIVARGLCEDEAGLGLLQRAERQDSWQQRRPAAKRTRKFVHKRARGAPRRHIDRRIGQREGAERARKPLDDAAFKKGRRKGFQERRAGCNGEDFLCHAGPRDQRRELQIFDGKSESKPAGRKAIHSLLVASVFRQQA